MRFAVALVLVACGEPAVPECGIEGIDCCIADSQCLDAFGARAPFCFLPGQFTGVCGECALHADCDSDERCYDGSCSPANCNNADCRP